MIPRLYINLNKGSTQDFIIVKDLVIRVIALGEGGVLIAIAIAIAAYLAQYITKVNYIANCLI